MSPSSRKTDRLFKPAEYAAAGIATYWRVETDPDVVVLVHELDGTEYRVTREVTAQAQLPTPFALTVDVPALRR